jgi:hypothetical protein
MARVNPDAMLSQYSFKTAILNLAAEQVDELRAEHKLPQQELQLPAL